jgi:hypothetical protein
MVNIFSLTATSPCLTVAETSIKNIVNSFCYLFWGLYKQKKKLKKEKKKLKKLKNFGTK